MLPYLTINLDLELLKTFDKLVVYNDPTGDQTWNLRGVQATRLSTVDTRRQIVLSVRKGNSSR